MTILITSDWHLNNNPRDEYRHAFQKRLRSLARNSVQQVIVLGDLTDDKDHHPAALVNRLVEHLYQLSRICPVAILKGNHDYTSHEEAAFFAFLGRLGDISWEGAPNLGFDPKNAPTAALGRLSRVLWLPHTHNYQRDWQGVDFRARWNWVFTHNTFEGVDAGHGRKLSGIPTKILPKGAKVISGDIHNPQELGPVTYVGSPYTVDFGEEFEPRILLIEKDKLRSIKCEGPQKRLIELGSLKEGLPVLHDYRARVGDIVKIRVNLGTGEYARWSEIKDKVMDWNDRHCGYQVHIIQPIVEAAARMSKTRTTTAPRSDQELLHAYAKQRGIDDRTTQVGLRLAGKT